MQFHARFHDAFENSHCTRCMRAFSKTAFMLLGAQADQRNDKTLEKECKAAYYAACKDVTRCSSNCSTACVMHINFAPVTASQ